MKGELMKREELKAMGLTDEQVESVMAKNGAEVAALNTQITTLQSEKSQLENDKKVITKEKEDKEKAIADLQKNSISKDEYDKKIKEIEDNAKKENEDYIYNDLLNKGLDDAKVLKDDLTREAFISLLNKDKIKLSDDKKSLIGLKEITDNYKKQAPHFFEKKKANGYEPVNPEGDRGDDDGEISMAANFAKEANKSESQNTKSQFFN
jgi:hypothetical protein